MAYKGDDKEWQAEILDQQKKQTELLRLIAARLEIAFETGLEAEDLEDEH